MKQSLLKIYHQKKKKKSNNAEILQVDEFFSDCEVLPDVTTVNRWE